MSVAPECATSGASSGDLQLYLFDAYENVYGDASILYLFGKVRAEHDVDGQAVYKSCCVIVNRVEQCFYALPREQHSVADVYIRLQPLMSSYLGSNTTKTSTTSTEWRAKPVRRRYINASGKDASELGAERDCLMVLYVLKNTRKAFSLPRNDPVIEHMIHEEHSPLERLLLHKSIRGPCWIRVKNATLVTGRGVQRNSQCALEYKVYEGGIHAIDVVERHEQPAPPPLNIASVHMTFVDRPQTGAGAKRKTSGAQDSQETPGFSALHHFSAIVHRSVSIDSETNMAAFCRERSQLLAAYHFSFVDNDYFYENSKLRSKVDHERDAAAQHRYANVDHDRSPKPTIQVVRDQQLLYTLVQKMFVDEDPDIVICHNAQRYGVPRFLAEAQRRTRLPYVTLFGRIRSNNPPFAKSKGGIDRAFWPSMMSDGRLVFDTQVLSEQYVKDRRTTNLVRSDSLQEYLEAHSLQRTHDRFHEPRFHPSIGVGSSHWSIDSKHTSDAAATQGQQRRHLDNTGVDVVVDYDDDDDDDDEESFEVDDNDIGLLSCDPMDLDTITQYLDSPDAGDPNELRVETARRELRCDEIFIDLWPSELPAYFRTTERLNVFMTNHLNACYAQLRFVYKLNLILFTRLLTEQCGNLWKTNLTKRTSDGIEYLIMHGLVEKNYIVPPRSSVAATALAKRSSDPSLSSSYRGGKILTEELGGVRCGEYRGYLYMIDVRSMYPNMIVHNRLCITNPKRLELSEEAARQVLVLPWLIESMLERRMRLLDRLSSMEEEENDYYVTALAEKAQKFITNIVYGQLGQEHFRFRNRGFAAIVTECGRAALTAQLDFVRSPIESADVGGPFEPVFGHTDSLLLHKPGATFEESQRCFSRLVVALNARQRHVQVKIDAVYRKVLVNGGNKYIALRIRSPDKYAGQVRQLDEQRSQRKGDWSVSDLHRVYKLQLRGSEVYGRKYAPIIQHVVSFLVHQYMFFDAALPDHDDAEADRVLALHSYFQKFGEIFAEKWPQYGSALSTSSQATHPISLHTRMRLLCTLVDTERAHKSHDEYKEGQSRAQYRAVAAAPALMRHRFTPRSIPVQVVYARQRRTDTSAQLTVDAGAVLPVLLERVIGEAETFEIEWHHQYAKSQLGSMLYRTFEHVRHVQLGKWAEWLGFESRFVLSSTGHSNVMTGGGGGGGDPSLSRSRGGRKTNASAEELEAARVRRRQQQQMTSKRGLARTLHNRLLPLTSFVRDYRQRYQTGLSIGDRAPPLYPELYSLCALARHATTLHRPVLLCSECCEQEQRVDQCTSASTYVPFRQIQYSFPTSVSTRADQAVRAAADAEMAENDDADDEHRRADKRARTSDDRSDVASSVDEDDRVYVESAQSLLCTRDGAPLMNVQVNRCCGSCGSNIDDRREFSQQLETAFVRAALAAVDDDRRLSEQATRVAEARDNGSTTSVGLYSSVKATSSLLTPASSGGGDQRSSSIGALVDRRYIDWLARTESAIDLQLKGVPSDEATVIASEQRRASSSSLDTRTINEAASRALKDPRCQVVKDTSAFNCALVDSGLLY